MNETRRAIGIGAFVVLALGTAWALEHRAALRAEQGTTPPAAVTPPQSSGAVPATAPEPQPEYDRSDLQLMQG